MQLLHTERELSALGVEVVRPDYFNRDLFADADIVHFFGTDTVHCDMATLLRTRGIPYVISTVYNVATRNSYTDRLKGMAPGTVRRLLQRFLRGAHALFPNSQSEARLLQIAWSVDDSALIPITNGTTWPEQSSRGLFYDTYLKGKLTVGERFILSVARLERNKNTFVLMQAAQAVDAFLVLIGRPGATNPDYGCFIQREAATRPDRILHIPEVSSATLISAYEDATVHALISTLESTGLSSLEAGSQGANLVVGDCPAVREYFGDIAWFCRAKDSLSVRAALRAALNADRNARGQREAIRREHSWKRAAEQTLSGYERVLARRRAMP